jgi:4,5-DOPA dioxygenase extradiol
MTRLPTLFLSHGSPMHALEPGASGKAWAALAQQLPRPRAVLIASAHWDTAIPMLTGTQKLETIHDFGGFPEPLYALRYDAPGAPDVAQRASALLKDAGMAAGIDGLRGIDHGAWVPLRWMYPDIDVPVVQLSVQTARGTAHHWHLGRALAPLAQEGVLIIGSGHATHNLRDWMTALQRQTPMPYAAQFSEWLAERIANGETEALIDYRSLEPDGARAHPTEEHFVPLLFAWGAAQAGARAERFHRGIEGGALAMDAYAFWPDDAMPELHGGTAHAAEMPPVLAR